MEMMIKLLLTAVAMAMDAFAVSVCKGLSIGNVKPKHGMITGAWFGGFQAGMPLLGYLIGSLFAAYITKFDHWIAFILITLIGLNMIKESFSKESDARPADASLGFTVMLTMAVATSIDALAVGVSYAMDPAVNIWLAITFIGVITFALSAVGVKIGSVFGTKYKSRAELVGGIVLVLIATYNLLEDLGVLAFG